MNKELEQILDEEIEVEESEVEVVEAVQTFVGYVVDCPKLNVRKDPNPKASVLCVIDRDAEVEVSESESTDHFYKIYLANGVEGFCMKQFIEVE